MKLFFISHQRVVGMKITRIKIVGSLLVIGFYGLVACSDAPEPQNNRGLHAGEKAVQEDGTNGEGDAKGDETTDNVGEGDATTEGSSNLVLSWDANSESDLTGYSIYGYVDDLETSEKVHSILVGDDGFDSANPKVSLAISNKDEFKAYLGKNACFFIRASNANGESDGSDAVCLQL